MLEFALIGWYLHEKQVSEAVLEVETRRCRQRALVVGLWPAATEVGSSCVDGVGWSFVAVACRPLLSSSHQYVAGSVIGPTALDVSSRALAISCSRSRH